jgi:hypothetical protein
LGGYSSKRECCGAPTENVVMEIGVVRSICSGLREAESSRKKAAGAAFFVAKNDLENSFTTDNEGAIDADRNSRDGWLQNCNTYRSKGKYWRLL